MELGRGMEALLTPRSIAILGASQDPTKIGGRPIQMLQRAGYPGAIYPVNPRGGEVQGLPAYRSIDDIPAVPDLAVIALAAELVPDAVEACAARGVRGAVVFSSGFSELGAAGEALQARLKETARRTGIRVLGPNCLGAVSIAERSIATFSIVLEGGMPPVGPLGIVSQSGNIGSYTMLLASERGVGVSRFMTTGNECDVDVADGIAWMARDDATRVILCCLETCRDAPRLDAAFAAARRAGKPVIVLKIGASAAGQAAAASHTGALAGADAVFDAVFARAGVWRVRSIEQLIDLGHAASVLGTRLPLGPGVALMTASGGFGVLLADAASAAGLSLPRMSEATQQRILKAVPYASPVNPVDATAQMSSRPEILSEVLSAVLEDPGSDSIVLLLSSGLYIPRLRSVYMAALQEIRAKYPDRVVVLSVHGPQDAVAELTEMGFAVADGIDATCQMLGGLVGLQAALRQPIAEPAAVPPAAPLDDDALLHEVGARRALAAAGIPFLPERLVRSAAAAADAAQALGLPVALKIVSPDLPHKTEVGGVALGIATAENAARAYDDMLVRVKAKAPSARIEGVMIAPMAGAGTELILGITRDPVFGPVVMAGLGGIFAELIQDVALRPAPVTEAEAMAMLRSLKAFPVLDGARGRPRGDLVAAAAAIAALSRFGVQHAERVAQIDINPLLMRSEGQGVVALDALLVGPAGKEHAA